MNIAGKMAIFIAPTILGVICKTTIVAASNPEEIEKIVKRPVKLFDLSFDLLLTSTSILIGLLLYVKAANNPTITVPGTTTTLTVYDVVICTLVQIVAIILIFGCTIVMSKTSPEHLDLATIWLPDLFGLFALTWIVVKLA